MSNNESGGDEALDGPSGDSPPKPVLERVKEPVDPPPPAGRLLDPWKAEAVEAEDRGKPIPGGEPDCPLCGAEMVRHVEKHPAPRAGDSPFRVRLVCSSEKCAAWTVYDW